MLKHITMEEAISILSAQPHDRREETVPLSEALNRVLSKEIRAAVSIPPFDKSPFDGYAYRASDVPGTLRVIGTICAGSGICPEIGPGEALKIFTGAPVPASADAVIKFEDVLKAEDGIQIAVRPPAGTNIIRSGEDCREGDLLVPAGTRLLPAHLGEIAGQGIASVRVWKKPKAFLLPTGSELAEPGEDCPKYGIYNSSSCVLEAYLSRMGFTVCRSPIVPDLQESVQRAVETGLQSDADVVFTTGGASVGDFDFAKRTAERIGAEILFWKVSVKPGGALLVSRAGHKLLIGLSGNPAAALMSLLVVLRPWLMSAVGSDERAAGIVLPLKKDMPKTSGATRLLRGHLDFSDGFVGFYEHEGRGNGNIASFAGCELIGIIPGGCGPLKKGDTIQVLRLPPELC